MKPLKTVSLGPLKLDIMHALGTLCIGAYPVTQAIVKDPTLAAELHVPMQVVGAIGVCIFIFAHSVLGISLPGDIAQANTQKPPTVPPAVGSAILALIVTCGVFGSLEACGAATPTPLEQQEVGQDLKSEAACIVQGATRADIDGCRNAVKAYWCGKDGGALHVAGACTYTPDGGPKDGGGG